MAQTVEAEESTAQVASVVAESTAPGQMGEARPETLRLDCLEGAAVKAESSVDSEEVQRARAAVGVANR